MAKSDMSTLLLLAGGAAAVYFITQAMPQATPLTIYPSLAWTGVTKQTSMAKTPAQQAAAAVQPTSLYSSVQQQAQSAIYGQCAGSYPACTPLLGDTQLGF
jgi:hypothetical protein